MCDIEKICVTLNGDTLDGEKCSDWIFVKTENQRIHYYDLKFSSYDRVIKLISSKLNFIARKTISEEIRKEVKILSDKIDQSSTQSEIDFIDLGMMVLTFFPLTSGPAILGMILKTGFKKMLVKNILNKKVSGVIANSFQDAVKKADSMLQTLSLKADMAGIYDKTVEILRADTKSLEKKTNKALGQIASNAAINLFASNNSGEGSSGKEFDEEINEDVLNIQTRVINLLHNHQKEIASRKRLEGDVSNDLFHANYLADSTERICYFHSVNEEYELAINQINFEVAGEKISYFDILLLGQLISTLFDKETFFNDPTIVRTADDYRDYADLVGRSHGTLYDNGNFVGHAPAKDETALGGNKHGGYDIFAKGNTFVKGNPSGTEDIRVQDLINRNPIAVGMISLLEEQSSHIRAQVDMDVFEFLLRFYDAKQ